MAKVTMNSAAKNYRTTLGESPNKYDLAIVSINSYGSPGPLNEYVISQLGYKDDILNTLNMELGYFLLQGYDLTPILFITTVGTEFTGTNLKKNLTKAITANQRFLSNKNIWIPLMGTGSGGLEFVDSYDTTIGVIKQFPNLLFTISIPNSNKGNEFVIQFKIELDSNLAENDSQKKNYPDVNYFLGGHIWEGNNQLRRFFSENIWENGHDTSDTEVVNSAKKGDFIFLKSTFAKASISFLRLKAIGIILNNPMDGHKLEVKWISFNKHIDVENLGKYRKTFTALQRKDYEKVLNKVVDNYPEFFAIIKNLINNLEENQSYDNEFPIDNKNLLFYGQKVGLEIAKYDIIFLPKSSYGGVGNNSISSHILNLLDIDKDLLNFSTEDLINFGFANHLAASNTFNKSYFLIFVVTRDQSKKHTQFDRQMMLGIENLRSYKKDIGDSTPLKIFIPFLGTGESGMPIEDSFKYLMPGIEHIKNTINYDRIRFNYPLKIEENKINSFNNLILNEFNLEPNSIPNNSYDEKLDVGQEKIPFHLDQVVSEDKLGREPVAKAFVDLIKNDIFTDKLNYSFMVHLQGEWGAGKSSFLNFIKQNLNSGNEKWIVVEYNSWQNQHIKPPWWTLIDQVYVQSKSQLEGWCKFQLRIKEIWRRLWRYSGWEKTTTFFVFVISLFFIMYFGQDIFELFKESSTVKGANGTTEKSISDTIANFLKLVITSTSVIATLYTLAKFITVPFFMNSSKEAESFVKKASDPMNKVKKHFSDLVDNINNKEKKRQLAIFIDDIDRCDKEFIVSLLEGIQTLFKEKRVLYIVAGDKNWITTSFGNMYLDFKPEDTNAKQLGEFFLEKAFQLSFRMPNISDEAKQNYWNSILGIKNDETIDSVDKLSESDKKEIKNVLNNPKSDLTDPVFMKKMERDFNLSEDSVSSLIIEEKNKNHDDLKHLLNDFHAFIDTNPRSIIRMANNYTMTRSTLIAERREFTEQKLFRWLVIEDLCPEIKSHINTATDIDSIKEKVNHMSNPIKQQNCLVLFDGIDDKDEQLTIEEIKIFKGL